MTKLTTPIKAQQIEQAIHVVRGQRVMLDIDLARIYDVSTGALNQAVKRNRDRFPAEFAFRLTKEEAECLKSQIVISKASRGGRRYAPWAFTEHGVAMLSSVLRSPVAARVNVEIMRAFIRLRRLMATPGELVEQLNRLAESVQLHDDQIRAITQVAAANDGAAARFVQRPDRISAAPAAADVIRTATSSSAPADALLDTSGCCRR